jgi:hypothetical protein
MGAIEQNWHDPAFVSSWRATRRKRLEQVWGTQFKPLLFGIPLAAVKDQALHDRLVAAVGLIQLEGEAISTRARRLDGIVDQVQLPAGRKWRVPDLLGVDDRGSWSLVHYARRARPEKLTKAQNLFASDLQKKAQRELACGLLGGEIHCTNGHTFRIPYECGNRYCVTCGPRGARRLFGKYRNRLFQVASRLLDCGNPDCKECYWIRRDPEKQAGTLPHWPPAKGIRPRVVVAKLDFTLLNTGQAPGPDLMRWLNLCIKRFCRAIERRWGIRRRDYGLAFCDELGKNNTNAHAHGIYVGPWLPQEKKELSEMWRQITGGSFIVSIKYARSFTAALYHAIKYPAKFAERSTPERLAELEVIFHRVRRFHTLAAFYNPDVPKEEKPGAPHCPACGELLSMPKYWGLLEDLDRRGIRDLATVEQEITRAKGLLALPP